MSELEKMSLEELGKVSGGMTFEEAKQTVIKYWNYPEDYFTVEHLDDLMDDMAFVQSTDLAYTPEHTQPLYDALEFICSYLRNNG